MRCFSLHYTVTPNNDQWHHGSPALCPSHPPHVLPLMHRLPGAIFQQENAPPHTARVSQDCLITVNTLPRST
ncbi:hypothetical protein TNCV_3877451 [Trichonephila clavipes]|uniref:Uncharacterized protein n=1 Tax=Trichonephila clavipes TaxID=2585209 RepID=A0A8X6VHP8_TRICX|nr:hypothetical protein TNCV_3877451 [Trichonephila clavipes]